MPTVYDVPADALIRRTARYLKENFQEITPPVWVSFAKTSSHLEQAPKDPDFWYVRCASLLRKLYLEGPIGVAHLRKECGGRAGKGNIGAHKRAGGGSAVRKPLEQLEKSGLVKRVDRRGRVLTKEGMGLLDSLAGEVMHMLGKDLPSLEKYG